MITDNVYFNVINDKFPHIGKKIELFWGTVEFNEMLSRLFDDTRDGRRRGFPSDVATALFRLSLLHDAQFPQFVKESTDIWGINNKPI